MNLAYVEFVPPDGAARRHVEEFARAARDLGHQVDLYSMNKVAAGSAGYPSRTRRPYLGIHLDKILRRYLHEPKELLFNLNYIREGTRLLRERRPEILLARDYFLDASYLAVARRLNIPLVIELNAPAIESRLYYQQYAHLPWVPEWFEKRKLLAADAVIVVSSALRDYLLRSYPVDSNKVFVNPNGADPSTFHPSVPTDLHLARELSQGPVVGFIGSFQRWRGSDLLAQLIRELGSLRPDVRFLLVGDGPDLKALLDSTGDYRDRIISTGWVDRHRIPGLVAGLDIAVLPESNFYSSPLKIVEWMAAGKAIVAPNYAAIRDLVTPGEDCLLFEPGDAASMLDAVVRLIDSPELAGKLGETARNHQVSRHTWRHNAERVLSICENIKCNNE